MKKRVVWVIAAFAVVITGLVAVGVAQASRTYYDFNGGNMSAELTTNFNAATNGTAYAVAANTGINGTNGLDVAGKDNIWTTQDSMQEVADHSWAVSGLFHNAGSNGYGTLGFGDQTINDVTETGSPIPQSSIQVVFHGDGGTIYSNGTSWGDIFWTDGVLSNGWWLVRLDLQNQGSDLYTLRFRIYQSDATGSVGDLLTQHIVYDVANSNFDPGEALHGFFGTENDRFDVVDNVGFGTEYELIPSLAQRFDGGTGSEQDPYLISTCEQLELIGTYDSLWDLHYALTGNVDCTATSSWHDGAGFKPIGGTFGGTFDGQGHTINGLFINRPNSYQVGLFTEAAEGSYIQNVRLTNIDITGNQGVGSLVGVTYGTVEDVHATGSVAGRSEVGGLIGGNNGWDTVIDSSADVDVNGESGAIGGLVGVNYGNIYGSSASGDVTGVFGVGGLVGSGNTGYESNAEIFQSYATGNVTGYSYVGGLAGELGYTDLYEDYAAGSVTGVEVDSDPASYIGGLIGSSFNMNVTRSYYTGTITDGSRIGGLIGYASDTTMAESFAHVTVDSSGQYQGGLVADASNLEIGNSYTHATLGGGSHIGGLVGSGTVTMYNSYATGSIGSTGQVLGGLMGAALNSDISDVFAAVSIASNNPLTVAGSIGGVGGTNMVNGYFDATIGKQVCWTVQDLDNPSTLDCNLVNEDGGDPDYFKNNSSNRPFDAWDFDTIWSTTNEYPCLAWSDLSCYGSDDFNGDGTVDGTQPQVGSYISSITGKRVVIDVGEGCELTTDDMSRESQLETQDAAYEYDYGLFDFAGSCGDPGFTTTIKLYYYDVDAATLIARKYNPNTKGYATLSGATITQQTINGSNVAVITYQLTDGGGLDTDREVNGEFTDPVGLARQVIGAPNTGIR